MTRVHKNVEHDDAVGFSGRIPLALRAFLSWAIPILAMCNFPVHAADSAGVFDPLLSLRVADSSSASVAKNPPGTSGRRIALVIGNGDYQYPDSLPRLSNPTHDAEDVAEALRNFGFEVIERKNQSLEAMSESIAEFGRKIGDRDAAVFYFAGHGIQVKNQNYLMPVNAKVESEAAVPYQGINLNQILDEMDSGKSKANIVILDACRNNPISGKFRSGKVRGLASPDSMPKGTVIVYSTDPGNVSADGGGRNGLFTAGLLRAFKGSDLSLDGVLTVASAEVERASGQKQTPYVNGPKTLQKTFYFGVTVDPGVAEVERTFWTSIGSSTDPADFEAYLRNYPKGSYRALAENQIRRLTASSKDTTSQPLPPTGSRFDGTYKTTITCQAKGNAAGYSYGLVAQVKDGYLKGRRGAEGALDSQLFQGAIRPDGSAMLVVTGLTGDSKFALGGIPPGSPLHFSIDARFDGSSGSGHRVEGRVCDVVFARTDR